MLKSLEKVMKFASVKGVGTLFLQNVVEYWWRRFLLMLHSLYMVFTVHYVN